MLADAEHVHAVVENLKRVDFGPLTVDPVMIAKGGAALLAADAIKQFATNCSVSDCYDAEFAGSRTINQSGNHH